jgi:hypothetical protein
MTKNDKLAQAFVDRYRLRLRYEQLARELEQVSAELAVIEETGKTLSPYWNAQINYAGFGLDEKIVKKLHRIGLYTAAQVALCRDKPKGINASDWYEVQEVLENHGIPTMLSPFRMYYTPGKGEQSW